MNRMTGLKDLDREVLKHIDDGKLLQVCTIDKRFWHNVCDDDFLRRRLFKYPRIEKYKLENETWKRFFLRVMYYVLKMKEEHGFVYTSGNFKKQYGLFQRYTGSRLVYEAAFHGEISMLKHLMVSHMDSKEDIFIVVSQFGRLDSVKWFVEDLKVNIHAQNDSALIEASENGHLEVVKYLVEHGADIHTREDYALSLATLNGHFKVVKYLLEQGTNIHAKNDRPLRWASVTGRLKIIKYLVDQGADISTKNFKALKEAEKRNYIEVANYLKSQIT